MSTPALRFVFALLIWLLLLLLQLLLLLLLLLLFVLQLVADDAAADRVKLNAGTNEAVCSVDALGGESSPFVVAASPEIKQAKRIFRLGDFSHHKFHTTYCNKWNKEQDPLIDYCTWGILVAENQIASSILNNLRISLVCIIISSLTLREILLSWLMNHMHCSHSGQSCVCVCVCVSHLQCMATRIWHCPWIRYRGNIWRNQRHRRH